MKNKLFFFLLFTVISCKTEQKNDSEKNEIDKIFEKKIEHRIISRGDNFPNFDHTKDSMDLFLISLHKNIPVSQFINKTGFSKEKIKQIESLLESKNWLYFDNGKPKPSIFIVTKNEGEKLFEYSSPISNEIVTGIKMELPKIKQQFNQTEISKTQSFEKWSFLILSDVLLDSWQIDNVEKEFLKQKKRPKRHGRNYYYSIMESTEKNRETFGIYGNQYEEKNGKSISIYGNNRTEISLNFNDNFISVSDNQILTKIAENFKPKLLSILNENQEYIRKVYKETSYEKEITFEEFFIWWYHFIYTKVTNMMNKNGMLEIPESGNFEYMLNE